MVKNIVTLLLSILVPHIMIFVGLAKLAKQDPQTRRAGKTICLLSSATIIIGSIGYFIFFTPLFRIDY